MPEAAIAIRWVLIGVWTMVVAFLAGHDDAWAGICGIVGGIMIFMAMIVLALLSIGQ